MDPTYDHLDGANYYVDGANHHVDAAGDYMNGAVDHSHGADDKVSPANDSRTDVLSRAAISGGAKLVLRLPASQRQSFCGTCVGPNLSLQGGHDGVYAQISSWETTGAGASCNVASSARRSSIC